MQSIKSEIKFHTCGNGAVAKKLITGICHTHSALCGARARVHARVYIGLSMYGLLRILCQIEIYLS
jgi:hypothetical protein